MCSQTNHSFPIGLSVQHEQNLYIQYRLLFVFKGPCHGPGNQWSASHREGPPLMSGSLWYVGRGFCPSTSFTWPETFHKCSILKFMFRPLLLEGRAGKPGNVQTKKKVSGIGERWLENCVHTLYVPMFTV